MFQRNCLNSNREQRKFSYLFIMIQSTSKLFYSGSRYLKLPYKHVLFKIPLAITFQLLGEKKPNTLKGRDSMILY